MDTTYQIIAALVGAGVVIMIAPRVLARNKGRILQNIAIWVGIFLLLALAYKTVGPGKNQSTTQELTAAEQPNVPASGVEIPPPQSEAQDTGNEEGFSPPSE